MKKRLFFLFCLLSVSFYSLFIHRSRELPKSVINKGVCVIDDIKELHLSGYKLYNPGVLDLGQRYLLVARQKASSLLDYIRLKVMFKRNNVIVITELDQNLRQITKPVQLLPQKDATMHKVTDPRLFMHENKVYMIFCDHSKGGSTQTLATLEKKGDSWQVNNITPLSFPTAYEFYEKQLVQKGIEKNWMPFSKDGKVYIVYLLEPEKVVLELNLSTGKCMIVSRQYNYLQDQFTPLRGGTPPIYDSKLNEFLTLYHIAFTGRNSYTNMEKKVYICGAYTFTNSLPFKITAKSKGPFYQANLYSNKAKIVFPTALICKKDHYLMFYGEDDCRIKVAVVNRSRLLATMKSSENE